MIINNFKNKKFLQHTRSRDGYTLVELLFYVSLFAVMTLLVINSMLTMTKAFRETSVNVELTQSSTILERISREVRNASVVTVTSVTPGNITINTTDETGTAKTMQFLLSGMNVQLWENSTATGGVNTFIGNLNSPSIRATTLTFNKITTTEGEALKILLTVNSIKDSQGKSVDFYNTVALRQSY